MFYPVDNEDEIVDEILAFGRERLAQAMRNLLIQRLVNEMHAFGEYRMWVDFQRWRRSVSNT